MKKNLPTVTVAISAYNEEKNIVHFLRSVLMQSEKGFKLKQIWVHSDGSTDKTVKFARSVNSNMIKVFDHKTRVGKSTWLNKIYKDLDTDFLVQSDADVVFADQSVIENMVKHLITSDEIAMCTGNPVPLTGKTFTEMADVAMLNTYWPILKNRFIENNVFSADGRILSYKKELVKKIIIPEDMIANDVFTYFCCISLGYKCRFISKAVVRFRASNNLKDKIRQNLRSAAIPLRMAKYFPKETVESELSLPFSVRLKLIISQLLRNPIYCFYIFLINKYSGIKAQVFEKNLNGKWEVALTTKELY